MSENNFLKIIKIKFAKTSIQAYKIYFFGPVNHLQMLLWDNNYPEGYLQVLRCLRDYHTLSAIYGRYSKSGQFMYAFGVIIIQQIPIFL